MGRMYYYKVYGLAIRSSQPLPYLAVSTGTDYDLSVTIRQQPAETHPGLEISTHPAYSSTGVNANGIPYFCVWRQPGGDHSLLARYTNGAEVATFTADRKNTIVNVHLSEGIRFSDMIAYLYGPVFGCMLRLRDQTCIHGGVVSIHGKAVIITGPKEAGKSTLTAALAATGCPVLSDDIAIVSSGKNNDEYFIQPGYPCLRLWEDTIVNLLNRKTDRLERVLAFTDKYYLPLATGENEAGMPFQPTALPLGGIYLLRSRGVNNSLVITHTTEYDATKGLLANAYAEYMLDGLSSAAEFMAISRIAKTVKVRTLAYADNMNCLDDVCRGVIEDSN
jgi:hypothetical protein